MLHQPIIAEKLRRFDALPVEGIAPIAGWSLFYFDEPTLDRGTLTEFVARTDSASDLPLCLSRRFTPTQARWAWLVASNFPLLIQRPHGVLTPIDNDDIDLAIAGQVAA